MPNKMSSLSFYGSGCNATHYSHCPIYQAKWCVLPTYSQWWIMYTMRCGGCRAHHWRPAWHWRWPDVRDMWQVKDDLLVRSSNTHSSSGKLVVNSPATHGPVWWKGLSERDYSPPPPPQPFPISQCTLLMPRCVYMYDHSKVYTAFHPPSGSRKIDFGGGGQCNH